jgi:hypothetical protein
MMRKKWTRGDAFAFFGTRLTNNRWSWSARSADGGIVVATLWQDEFKGRVPHQTYSRPGYDPDDPDDRPGYVELLTNLQWALNHCSGKVNTVVAIAKDRNAKPRRIAECYPQPNLVMRVTHLDASTGAFTLEQVAD